jgi:hypothetical protein
VPGIATSGSTVKISGYKFTGSSHVSFGGIPAASFVVNSDNLITAVVGAGSSGDVAVGTPTVLVNYPGFIYTTAPVISSITPESAPVGSTVTISGFNFNSGLNDNTIYFGSVKATVLSATSTKIVVAVPLGATYQPISVTSSGLTAFSARPFNVSFATLGSLGVSSFAARVDSTGLNTPIDISVADIDLDGKNDVAVTATTSFPASVLVLFKNSSIPDTISFSTKKPITANNVPQQTIFRDVDGDGILDMIVANWLDKNGASIFRNTSTVGNISFANEFVINSLKLGRFSISL